jgi:hypothetical protein
MECKVKQIDFQGGGVVCKYLIPVEGQCGFCKRPKQNRCLEEIQMKPIPLSHSSIQNFLTCKHLFYLKEILGIRTKDRMASDPIKAGALWDYCQRYLHGEKVDLEEIVTRYEIQPRLVAKVRALHLAYKELGIKSQEGYTMQGRFKHHLNLYDNKLIEESELDGYDKNKAARGVLTVKGFYDRKYEDYFVENKLTGRPENYFDIWFLQSQVGTYFLVDESLKKCIMEVTRIPDLRSTGKFADETDEEYCDRCLMDILHRPTFYFIGYDKETGTYGKTFYRNEFQLTDIRDRYKHIAMDIHHTQFEEGFYKNDRVCNNILPGIKCDMLDICKYGKFDETRYEFNTYKKGGI